jgi:dipeptidase
VIANQVVIRGIDPNDKENFMFSDNIFDVAKRNNLWTEADGQLDFLKVYAPERAHSTYATRRVWRIFTWAAPSLNLPPDTDAFGDDYPFFVAGTSPAQLELRLVEMQSEFGGPQWALAREIMGMVQERSSNAQVCRDFKRMIEHLRS